MQLRTALADYKRTRRASTRFPGERRTTAGRFSGLDSRLVHVAPDGSIRDFSHPLVGLDGVAGSRFGLEYEGETDWFDGADARHQEYEGRTGLVVTEFDLGDATATKYDLTVGTTHYTHVRTEGVSDADLRSFLRFSPDGHDERVGKLVHEDAVECYRDREYDALVASEPFGRVRGHVLEVPEELLGESVSLPRYAGEERSEDSRLGGDVDVTLPVGEDGVTVAVALFDREETDVGGEGVPDVRERVRSHAGLDALRSAAREQASKALPDVGGDAVGADLRVLSLLSAPTGARIAGPDFDPLYLYSGGYGYTWFRDDAEVARHLLDAAEAIDADLDDWHERSARFFLDTRLPDGTWPHRVWPHDGSLAPGWANGRLEDESGRYQADQTASVAAFLADYLRVGDPPADLRDAIVDGLEAATDALDGHRTEAGLPAACQNAWENMQGQFTHTAATYLHAYASIARAPVPEDLAERGQRGAESVHDALEDLWIESGGIYALRRTADGLDERLDSSTFALLEAHAAYADVHGLSNRRARRLAAHLDATLSGLWRDPPESEARGLVRFEGDEWRTREQGDEKIWTVSTAWGASATRHASDLLADRVDAPTPTFEQWTQSLLGLLADDGPLAFDGGYLPEQVFDDGTPDSATPLGWPHALRLATVANADVSPGDVAPPLRELTAGR